MKFSLRYLLIEMGLIAAMFASLRLLYVIYHSPDPGFVSIALAFEASCAFAGGAVGGLFGRLFKGLAIGPVVGSLAFCLCGLVHVLLNYRGWN